MAKKKSGGSSKNGRDSLSKRLGVKKHEGSFVTPGNIIIRQNGLKFKSGLNTFISKNYTIISKIYGYVYFKKNKNIKKIMVL